MTIIFRAVRGLRQQPLLVCVSNPDLETASASGYSEKAATNVRRLIRLWEEREALYTAIRSDLKPDLNCQTRSRFFAAGELVFDSVRCSILRNHKFRNFHDDIGAPPIIMIGGALEIDDYCLGDRRLLVRHTIYDHRRRGVSSPKSQGRRVRNRIEDHRQFRGRGRHGVRRKRLIPPPCRDEGLGFIDMRAGDAAKVKAKGDGTDPRPLRQGRVNTRP